jgi:hypothetical protein
MAKGSCLLLSLSPQCSFFVRSVDFRVSETAAVKTGQRPRGPTPQIGLAVHVVRTCTSMEIEMDIRVSTYLLQRTI